MASLYNSVCGSGREQTVAVSLDQYLILAGMATASTGIDLFGVDSLNGSVCGSLWQRPKTTHPS